MTPDELREMFGGHWSAHPKYPVTDWQYDVANDDTRLGYWEWVLAKIEQEES